MQTAGEGGPYGMALLASFMAKKQPDQSLDRYLNDVVFANAPSQTLAPDPEDVAGFGRYIKAFARGLALEKSATELF
jgi:hypothetical protein